MARFRDTQEPTLAEPLPIDPVTQWALPYADGGITAGFPSPAQDYMCGSIDLNEELVPHRETTFYARVCGDSMIGRGIFDGDLVVIDRSLEPVPGDCVVACVDGEFTIKEYRPDPSGHGAWLLPANKRFRPRHIGPEADFRVWGVVTYTIKSVSRRGSRRAAP